MRIPLLIVPIAVGLVACGGDDAGSGSSAGNSLEATLAGNTQWPYELVGTLDIVEAGDFDESDYPAWAVGSVVTDTDEWGVLINIGPGVIRKAKVNIDSGKKVRVWLEKPRKENGDLFYPVSKIQAL